MVSLFVRVIIVVTIVVSVTDAAMYYKMTKKPGLLNIKNLILIIFITILPIAIILWYHMIFRNGVLP
jgi:hypothetical protein